MDKIERDFVEWLHDGCVRDGPQTDLRPIPTQECACGSRWFRLLAWFDDNEIGGYLTDMECASCGTLYGTPVPPDAEIADVVYESE